MDYAKIDFALTKNKKKNLQTMNLKLKSTKSGKFIIFFFCSIEYFVYLLCTLQSFRMIYNMKHSFFFPFFLTSNIIIIDRNRWAECVWENRVTLSSSSSYYVILNEKVEALFEWGALFRTYISFRLAFFCFLLFRCSFTSHFIRILAKPYWHK